ncbi:MAG: RNA polymerase sigma factor [Sarcina sp.]
MNCRELEKLIDEFGDYIYSFCLKLTRDKTLAQDLYQNTFLKAVEIQEKIDVKSAKNYIIGISIKLWKNQKRKQAIRNKIAFFISSDDKDYVEKNIDKTDIESDYIREEEKMGVAGIITKMNDKIRLPIIMFYNLEMSIEEISNLLNIPKGTVKSRLNKGRNIVKEEILKEEYKCTKMA